MHPRLKEYFNGSFDRVYAAFTASAGLSSSTKGSLRESGVRQAFEHSLPSITRLCSGDVIDSAGHRTGQLDGLVVHANSPALGLESEGGRVVLAEGVVGVIEVKSNLVKQWRQVEKTWSALCPIRRAAPTLFSHQGLLNFGNSAHPSEQSIPFYVIGQRGWAKSEELMIRAKALHQAFGSGYAPPVYIFVMDPPSFGAAVPLEGTNYQGAHHTWSADERGQVVAQIWAQISNRARVSLFVPIDWNAYFTPR